MGSNFENSTIMIVDDNPVNIDLLDSILVANGYNTISANNGQQALELAAARIPDLILLDINMPAMDGFEVCRRLKNQEMLVSIPVIFISALTSAADKVKAFQVGGVDYMTKPFQMAEVLVRVENQLILHRQKRELQDRYMQIHQMQTFLRSFLSQSAWESLENDFLSTDIKYEPQYETMTILMSDVAGFTKVTDMLEPNSVVASLSLYMNMISRIVYQFEGEVDKFMGDGMFAFFRDPVKGVEAAVRIQKRVETFNAQQSLRGGIPMPTRIGIATGRVLLALIGSTARREYTLIGDSVNVASRLQVVAPVGKVMMDESTYNAAGLTHYESTDFIALKGKEGMERIYTL